MSALHCQSSEYHGPHEWVGQSGLRRDCPGVKDLMRALRESVAAARAVSGEQAQPDGPMFEGANAGPLNLAHADTARSARSVGVSVPEETRR